MKENPIYQHYKLPTTSLKHSDIILMEGKQGKKGIGPEEYPGA